MQVLVDGLFYISQLTQPYIAEIALTLLATALVIFGDVINKHIKRMLSPYHFVIRTLVFVLICAFGYGVFIVYSTPLVKQGLMMVPYLYRGVVIVALFLLLGYLAENRRYI